MDKPTKAEELARINAPRLQRIMDALDLIDKSAASQKVSLDDVAALLKPVCDRLLASWLKPTAVIIDEALDVPEPETGFVTKLHKDRLDISLWEHAQTAPLSELLMAWETINARLVDQVSHRHE